MTEITGPARPAARPVRFGHIGKGGPFQPLHGAFRDGPSVRRPPIANKRQPKDHQAARPRDYGAAAGTTLMLLNGDPLISLVLTTV
jgi:hypothetical protein